MFLSWEACFWCHLKWHLSRPRVPPFPSSPSPAWTRPRGTEISGFGPAGKADFEAGGRDGLRHRLPIASRLRVAVSAPKTAALCTSLGRGGKSRGPSRSVTVRRLAGPRRSANACARFEQRLREARRCTGSDRIADRRTSLSRSAAAQNLLGCRALCSRDLERSPIRKSARGNID